MSSSHPGHRRAAPLRAWAVLCAVLAATAAPATAAVDYASAVNVAGRQRMLTQRIVKSYCAVGLGIVADRSARQLHDALDTYRRQLDALRALDVGDGARAALERVQALWARFEPVARAEVRRGSAEGLWRLSETLLDASHQVVVELERESGSPIARLVNVSGRQRMLSQRLAKLYLLRAWGFESDEIETDLALAKAEFVAGHEILVAAPENTTELLEELAAVGLQWTWFEYAIELQGARSYLLVVDDSSESILNSMESITAMYEALSRR